MWTRDYWRASLTGLAGSFFSLWLALTLSFVILRSIPGDSIDAQMRSSGASESDIATYKQTLGLDRSLAVQYARYLAGLARGDFGRSLVTREPVLNMIGARLGPTLTLSGLALLVACGLGIGTGAISNLGALDRQNTLYRTTALLAAPLITLALAAPIFWTGTIVLSLGGPSTSIKTTLIPVLVLGFHASGPIGRVMSTSLNEAFAQPFIQTARAKGLPDALVFHHALKFAILPVVSVIALQAGFLLGGTVIIETIFTRRGLGSLMHQAALNQDYPVVQGLVVLNAAFYALTRRISDALRRRMDPRPG